MIIDAKERWNLSGDIGFRYGRLGRSLGRAWPVVSGVMLLSLGWLLAACSTNLNSSGGPETGFGETGTTPGATVNTDGSVKIALLLPLAGFNKTAAIAKSMKQAAEMALFERDDPKIQLIVKDDKGSAEGAMAAADEAIRDGAQIILGPLLSKSVSGAASVARRTRIPVVSYSNDESVAGNGVYLMSFLPHQEVERISNFAVSRGKRRFAALIPDTVYGKTVEATFRNTVQRLGGQVVTLERYPAGPNGMLEPAKRVFEIIKESQALGSPIDALFLPGGQETLPSLGPLIAYSQIDLTRLQLLGTGGWDFPNIGRDNAFVGGWYPSPDPRGWKNFSGRFAQNFGQAPPRLASLAYDSVNMAISVARAPNFRGFTGAALSQPQGFQGVDGLFHFTPSGLSKRSLAVLSVMKFGSSVVDPAPRSFASGLGAESALGGRAQTGFNFGTSQFVPAPISQP